MGARGGATGMLRAVGGAGGKGVNGADGGAFVWGPFDVGGGKRIVPSKAVSFINDLIASRF